MTLHSWLEKSQKFLEKLRQLSQEEYTPRALALIFLVALGTGAGIKSLVHDHLTMGYDDYRLVTRDGSVDLNALERELIHRGGTTARTGASARAGESCAETEGE